MVLSHYAAWVINGSMPHPILAVVIYLLKDFLNQRIHFGVVILKPHVLPSCLVLSATCKSNHFVLAALFISSCSLPLALINSLALYQSVEVLSVSLDLKSNDDCWQSSFHRAFVEFSVCPSIRNPSLGKGLLRLPPFYAKCLPISFSSLLDFTTTEFH